MTLWQIWWFALTVKTILLPILPITPDETYYFMWARHLSLSYYDHPPFVAWIMTLAIPLWKTPVGIRLPGIVFQHLGYIPWIFILRRLNLSQRAQIFWMLSLILGPLTGLGGFVITPDVPLVFFWSLSLWALLWVLDEPSIPRWVVLGISIGLGLLSKYMMVLFFPSALLWLIWDKRIGLLKKPGVWIALGVSLVVALPVFIWNMQNHFASFAFQTRHGFSTPQHEWGWPLEYLATQVGMLNPFVLIPTVWYFWKKRTANRLLVSFASVPFLFFFLTSFRARVEANWPVCGYPCVMALFGTMIDDAQFSARIVSWIKMSFLLSTAFILLVISHTVHPWLPIPKDKDHTEIMREWLVDIPSLQKFRPLFARSYQMAAFHSYYRASKDEVFKLAGLDRVDYYDFLPQSTPTHKGFIVLKADDQFSPGLDAKYSRNLVATLPSKLVVYELTPK